MDSRSIGLPFIVLGVALALIGVLAVTGALSWFGRLPGDIRINSGASHVYIPITTMILLSLGLSLVLYIGRRFF
jgi:membrane protein implicated in regulation of membrane protease activity